MYEKKHDPLLPRAAFIVRLGGSLGFALLIVVLSLWIGAIGYHYFGELSWIDALLNAAMILTGMGPVNPMKTTSAKLFAAFYALYSGVAFLTMMAVVLAPLVHRLLHMFHLDEEEEKAGE